MQKRIRLGATVLASWAACGNAPNDQSGTPNSSVATVVGRIQGTEFVTPAMAASVWLESQGLGALRLSESTDGCGAPDGWSVLVQVNTAEENEYVIGMENTESPGEGFLVEYRREDGTVDMPAAAAGDLTLTYMDEEYVAGSMLLETDGGAELTAVFEAPVCQATTLVD
jgi:hypothetical protein